MLQWTSYGFLVSMDLLIPGRGDFIASIESLQSIDSGFVASIPDLLLLGAITTEECRVDKDIDDSTDLMELAIRKGLRFGFLTEEEMEGIVWAGISASTEKIVDASELMQFFCAWMRGGDLLGRLEADNSMKV